MRLTRFAAALSFAAFAVAPVMAQELTGTLKKIKDSGTIVLGTRESSGALAYTLGDGKYVGFHTEMSERIAKDLQRDLKLPKLDVKYQPVTSQNRQDLVKNGTVDLECGSTTNNANRQKEVAFAMTTYVEEGRIVVRANSPIKGIADLNGKTVATTTGTTSVQTLRKNKKAQNMDFKEVFGKDHADSFLLLETGRADAFVMDGQIVAGLVSKSKNPADYKILPEALSVEPIACMMRKDDPAFKKAVDASIQAMVKSGDLAKMYDKWFMQPIPPANTKVGLPLSDATKNAWNNPNDKPMEEYQLP
jgi:glutamate/aspartate transport system substrate-binding protein